MCFLRSLYYRNSQAVPAHQMGRYRLCALSMLTYFLHFLYKLFTFKSKKLPTWMVFIARSVADRTYLDYILAKYDDSVKEIFQNILFFCIFRLLLTIYVNFT